MMPPDIGRPRLLFVYSKNQPWWYDQNNFILKYFGFSMVLSLILLWENKLKKWQKKTTTYNFGTCG